jgi:hypothetical protein
MGKKEKENIDELERKEANEQISPGTVNNRTFHITNNNIVNNHQKVYNLNVKMGGKNFAFAALIIEVILLILQNGEFSTWILNNSPALDTIISISIYGIGIYLILWVITSSINYFATEEKPIARGNDTYMRDSFNISQNISDNDIKEKK